MGKPEKKRKVDFLNNTLENLSVRKYSVGVACVLTGTLIFIGVDKDVSADEISENILSIETESQPEIQPGEAENVPEAVETEPSAIPAEETPDEEAVTETESEPREESVPEAEAEVVEEGPAVEETLEQEVTEPVKEEAEPVEQETVPEEETDAAEEESVPQKEEGPAVEEDAAIEEAPAEEQSSVEDEQETEPAVDQPTHESGHSTVKEASVHESESDGVKINENTAPVSEPADTYTIDKKKETVTEYLEESLNINQESANKIIADMNLHFTEQSEKEIQSAIIKYLVEQSDQYTNKAILRSPYNRETSTNLLSANEVSTFSLDGDSELSGNVNTPYIKEGIGQTTYGSRPVYYTITATPNQTNNKVDFVIEFEVTKYPNGTIQQQGGHRIQLGGFQFGPGFNVPATIPVNFTAGQVNINTDLMRGGTANSLPGYSLRNPLDITGYQVLNNQNGFLRFSLGVNDWDSALDFTGNIAMFTSGNSSLDVQSTDNYFYGDSEINHDFNPDYYVNSESSRITDPIAYETIYRTTNDLPAGESRVVQTGIYGERERTETTYYYKDELINTETSDWSVTRQAVNQIIELGVGDIEDAVVSEDVSEEIIEYQTIYRPNPNLEIGQTNIVQSGVNGVLTKKYEVRIVNGVSKKYLTDSNVTQKAVNEVIEFGISPANDTNTSPILPGVDTSTERGEFNGQQGTWVTITFTNTETGQVLDEERFFIPDGQEGSPGETPHIGDNGNWFIGEIDTGIAAQGPQGPDGTDGLDGNTVRIEDNDDGSYDIIVVDPNTGEEISRVTVRDGVDGQTPNIEVVPSTDPENPGYTIIITNPETGETEEIFIRDGIDGEDGTDGADGQDGVDGNTVRIEENDDGSHDIIVTDPNTGEEISRVTVRDGQDGTDGADGQDGVDGESPTINIINNEDDSYTIVITNPDGTVTETVIRDGEDGTDGVDGQTPNIEVVPSTDSENPGYTIIVTNPETGETEEVFVRDGIDGEDGIDGADGQDGQDGADGNTVRIENNGDGSYDIIVVNPNTGEEISRVTVRDGEDGVDGESPTINVVDNGGGSHTIVITKPDGTVTETVIRDGQDGVDGQTPNIEVVPSTDPENPGYTIITTNPETGETKEIFVKDGIDGEDGTDGIDGNTVRIEDNGDGSYDIIVVNPNTGEEISRVTVRDGEDGTDGVDGESSTINIVDNGDGSYTIVITNPDGTTSETVVRDGVDGNTVLIEDNGDGSYDIIVVNPNTDEEISRVTVRDGEDGTDGADGQNGVDGQTPNIEVVPSTDLENPGYTIIITNPETGETEEVFVRDGIDGTDGADGQDGVDGQTPNIEVVPSTDPENPGYTIIITNPETGETEEIFVKDGIDGEDGTDGNTVRIEDNGDGSYDIIVVNPNTGEEISRVTVRDGQDGVDGQTPNIEVVPSTDPENPGYTIIITNPETGETEEVFVRDGIDGEDGTDGLDGNTVRIEDNDDGSYDIIVVDSNTGEEISRVTVRDGQDGTDGADGQDGVDGESPTINIINNEDDSYTIVITNPDGTTSEIVVHDGQDGIDGLDGQTPNIEVVPSTDAENPGYTIIITNPETAETEEVFVRDGIDGENGTDGTDGLDGNTVRIEDNDDGSYDIIVVDSNTGEEISRVTVRDGEDGINGVDGQDGTDGADGQDGVDGNTVRIEDNGDGSYDIIVVNPNTEEEISRVTVRDGEDGQDGTDGVDGESPTINIVDNGDGSYTIVITKPDGTVAETVIRDGQDGIDGQTPNIEVVPSTDPENPGYTIIITNPETREIEEVFIRDGIDGENGTDGLDGNTVRIENNGDGSYDIIVVNPNTGEEISRVTVSDGEDGQDGTDGVDGESPTINIVGNEDGSYTIVITKPDGTISETVIRDGIDGQTPNIEVVPSTDSENPGYTIIITNPETGETEEVFVRDGIDGEDGTDGADGQDGLDGNTVRIEDNSDGSYDIIVVNPNTEEEISRVTVRDGADGVDGQTPNIEVVPSTDPENPGYTIIITNPETGETEEIFVKDGIDGEDGTDGLDGNTVRIEDNGDGSYDIIVVNPNTGEEISRVTVRDGEDGHDGESITIINSYLDANGNTIINFSDGSTVVIPPGTDGESITIINQYVNQSGNVVIVFNDGSIVEIPGYQGDKVINNIEVTENGDVLIIYTDGTTKVIFNINELCQKCNSDNGNDPTPDPGTDEGNDPTPGPDTDEGTDPTPGPGTDESIGSTPESDKDEYNELISSSETNQGNGSGSQPESGEMGDSDAEFVESAEVETRVTPVKADAVKQSDAQHKSDMLPDTGITENNSAAAVAVLLTALGSTLLMPLRKRRKDSNDLEK